jgi:hypothetical protein
MEIILMLLRGPPNYNTRKKIYGKFSENWRDGGQGVLPLGLLPLWGSEGVTLIVFVLYRRKK